MDRTNGYKFFLLHSPLLIFLIFSCSSGTSSSHNHTTQFEYKVEAPKKDAFILQQATSEPVCREGGGVWESEICWRKFKSESLSRDEVKPYVDREVEKFTKIQIHENGNPYPVIKVKAQEQKTGVLLYLLYGREEIKTLLFLLEYGKFDEPHSSGVNGMLVNGNFFQYTTDVEREENILAVGILEFTILDPDSLGFSLQGQLSGKESFSLTVSEMEIRTLTGMGSSEIEIQGHKAYLTGELGILTYKQIHSLITDHPTVKILVLDEVSGSVNNTVNFHTGRLIRKARLTTEILSGSNISSGGVDLFLAGNKRIVQPGARIGIHSWCCINGYPAISVPKNHPAHRKGILYYTEMIGEQGRDFYFYTLEASPDPIRWMGEKEIREWGIKKID